MMVEIRGMVEELKPRMEEILKIVAGSIGLHYVGKISEWANAIPVINSLPEKWRGLILSYLIYKWGGRIHEVVSTVGAFSLVAFVEKLIAPYLPGSETVIKPLSSGESPEEYLKKKYGI